jgi:hypothetical protein
MLKGISWDIKPTISNMVMSDNDTIIDDLAGFSC